MKKEIFSLYTSLPTTMHTTDRTLGAHEAAEGGGVPFALCVKLCVQPHTHTEETGGRQIAWAKQISAVT
jgi:hypothetical protein